MRYGVSVPNVGGGVDARAIAESALEAEDAGWDGAFPMKVEGGRILPMTPEDAREVARYVACHRAASDPFELVVAGETPGEDRKKAARIVGIFRVPARRFGGDDASATGACTLRLVSGSSRTKMVRGS